MLLLNCSVHILSRSCNNLFCRRMFSLQAWKPYYFYNPTRFSHSVKQINKKVSFSPLCTSNKYIFPFKNFSRSFKTSDPRYLHPAIWLVLRPVLKLVAIFTGRGFRKWWRDLPKDKKRYFVSRVKANQKKIAIYVGLTFILCGAYLISHIEETPITKRKRFMAFNFQQLQKINEFELETILQKVGNQILPPTHPASKRVEAVVRRIVKANADLEEVKQKSFNISVINSPIENAFVLPIGHVFVFMGMLNLCSNDDQLGVVISHEIAHCIQNHGAENVSFTHLVDLVSVLIIAAIWAIVPSDMISLLTHWIYQKSMQVLLELPYNRKIETEADFVGLELAAKACFDVRESSAFWSKMAFLQKTFGSIPEIEFLSTHPSHETRSEYLDTIMEKAIKIRSECGCPKLKYQDPRNDVESISRALEKARRQYLEQHPKIPVIVKV